MLKSYRIRKATGDKYAGSWPADEFEKNGIEDSPSEKPKHSRSRRPVTEALRPAGIPLN